MVLKLLLVSAAAKGATSPKAGCKLIGAQPHVLDRVYGWGGNATSVQRATAQRRCRFKGRDEFSTLRCSRQADILH